MRDSRSDRDNLDGARSATSNSVTSAAEAALKIYEENREKERKPKLTKEERTAVLEEITRQVQVQDGSGTSSADRFGQVQALEKGLSDMKAEMSTLSLPKSPSAEASNDSDASPKAVPKASILSDETVRALGTEEGVDQDARARSRGAAEQLTERGNVTSYTTCAFTELESSRFISNTRHLAIDSHGKLQVWAAERQSANGTQAYSWRDPNSVKAEVGGIGVQCLYVSDGGKVLDAQGNEVKVLATYNGAVSTDLALRNFNVLKEGEIATARGNIPHAYFHGGDHVVFTKGTPPGLKVVDSALDSGKSAIVQENIGSIADTEAQQSQEAETSKQSFSSEFSKHTFDVRDRFGRYVERHEYLRRDAAGGLEVFLGKTREGRDVWGPSETKQFTALYVHQGKIFDGQGRQLSSVRDGDFTQRAEAVAGKLSFGKNGIGSLPSNQLNEFSYGGKRVVFLHGAPPAR